MLRFLLIVLQRLISFKKYYLTLQRRKNSGQNSMNMDKEKLIHSIRVQENSSFKGIDLQIGCDGKRIVTWDDNRLDIWDSDNMQNLLSVASVIKPVLSPERKRLLSATEEGYSICLYDIATGALLQTMEGHTNTIRNAHFSMDGKAIVSSSIWDNTVRVWDSSSGQCLHILEMDEISPTNALMDASGNFIAVHSFSGISVWDIRTKQIIVTYLNHIDVDEKIVFSPNGKQFAYMYVDVHIWDVDSWTMRCQLKGHSKPANFMVYSSDSNYIVTTSYDKTARIWDAHTGECLHVLEGHGGWPERAVFSNDQTLLATGCGDAHEIYIWEVATGRCLHKLQGDFPRVLWIDFNDDGSRLLSATKDGMLRVFDVANGSCLHVFKGSKVCDNRMIAKFLPDGKRIVTISDEGTLNVWQI